MYSNRILNFQESTTILNACTKKSGNLLNAPHILSVYQTRVFFNSKKAWLVEKRDFSIIYNSDFNFGQF